MINWKKKSKESILEGLDNLIKWKLLSDKKIFEESLITWQSAVLAKVDKKNSKLKTWIKSSKSNPILKQIDVMSCLEALQKKFFLVYVNGNIEWNRRYWTWK